MKMYATNIFIGIKEIIKSVRVDFSYRNEYNIIT